MLVLTTLPSWSRRRRETGLFGFVRKREYLTFISIRFVAFSNQHFADYRSQIVLVFFEAHFKLDFQALLSKLTSLNASMFSCHRVKTQSGKQPTVSELDMDKIVLRAK